MLQKSVIDRFFLSVSPDSIVIKYQPIEPDNSRLFNSHSSFS